MQATQQPPFKPDGNYYQNMGMPPPPFQQQQQDRQESPIIPIEYFLPKDAKKNGTLTRYCFICLERKAIVACDKNAWFAVCHECDIDRKISNKPCPHCKKQHTCDVTETNVMTFWDFCQSLRKMAIEDEKNGVEPRIKLKDARELERLVPKNIYIGFSEEMGVRIGMVAEELGNATRGATSRSIASKLASATMSYDDESAEIRIKLDKNMKGLRIDFKSIEQIVRSSKNDIYPHRFARSTNDPYNRTYPNPVEMISALGYGGNTEYARIHVVDVDGKSVKIAFAANPMYPGIFLELASNKNTLENLESEDKNSPPEIPLIVPQDIMAHFCSAFPAWGDPLLQEVAIPNARITQQEAQMTDVDGKKTTIFFRIAVFPEMEDSLSGLEKNHEAIVKPKFIVKNEDDNVLEMTFFIEARVEYKIRLWVLAQKMPTKVTWTEDENPDDTWEGNLSYGSRVGFTTEIGVDQNGTDAMENWSIYFSSFLAARINLVDKRME